MIKAVNCKERCADDSRTYYSPKQPPKRSGGHKESEVKVMEMDFKPDMTQKSHDGKLVKTYS